MKNIFNILFFSILAVLNINSIAANHSSIISLAEENASWGASTITDFAQINSVEVNLIQAGDVAIDLTSGMLTTCMTPEEGAQLCAINLVDKEQLPVLYPTSKGMTSYTFEHVEAWSTMTFNVVEQGAENNSFLCGAVILGNTGIVLVDNRELTCLPRGHEIIDNKLIINFEITHLF